MARLSLSCGITYERKLRILIQSSYSRNRLKNCIAALTRTLRLYTHTYELVKYRCYHLLNCTKVTYSSNIVTDSYHIMSLRN